MRIDDFVNLPPAVRNVMYAMGGFSLVGVAGFFSGWLALVVAVGLVALLLAVLCFFWIRSILRKRRAASMTSELTQHSSSAPTGVGDAAGRAKLDDLRKTFSDGIAKCGIDNIYKFPWYLIVGEPGSGKTEAIRHCGVGFPPGMHEKGTEQLGVGGTINMNWWFTNSAVFLDTAGKLMFEDVAPGQTSEWREFLQLLVRNRKNCPINGLMLVIPSDALISDDQRGMEVKASKIAAQFEVIQRTLDVRFPVFVVITKCDKLSGFREFFDGFKSTDSINQMLGWSNPAERDAPFAPELVTDHLATVVQRIKKRRLSILRNPIPQKETRRADEVDALFSLPRSIELIGPRLRQYLEKIFIAGPWSPKPLFLRGIYFTSSMCEGAALDQELALALGIGADACKDLKGWTKERTYFLKDIFTEKVFREKGLVTRATNTRKMLRTRSLILYGTGIALALALAGFTFYGYQQFSDSIKQHLDIWTSASRVEKDDKGEPDWKNGVWKPIVSSNDTDPTPSFRGTGTKVLIGTKEVDLLTYQSELEKEAVKPIETSWVFKPMLKLTDLDDKRKLAQRIVFEGSTIFPIVKAARERMSSEQIESAPDSKLPQSERLSREIAALKALLKIESDQLTKSKVIDRLSTEVFAPLVEYATLAPARPEQIAAYRDTLAATYTNNSKASWVPARLSKGYGTLKENKAIQNGVERLRKLSELSVTEQMSAAKDIREIRDELSNFRKIEHEMESFDVASGQNQTTSLQTHFGRLKVSKGALDKKVKNAQDNGVLNRDNASMFAAYNRVVDTSRNAAKADIESLRKVLEPHLAKSEAHMFAEIDAILADQSKKMEEKVNEDVKNDKPEEIKELDAYLQDASVAAAVRKFYVARYDTYASVFKVADDPDVIPKDMIGTGWTFYKGVADTFKTTANDVAKAARIRPQAAKDDVFPDLTKACDIVLNEAKAKRLGAIENAYLSQSYTLFDNNFGVPYVNKGSLNRGKADELKGKWSRDSVSENAPSAVKEKLAALTQKYSAMEQADAKAKEIDAINAENKAKKDAYRTALAKVTYIVSIDHKQKKWHTANNDRDNIFKSRGFIKVATITHGRSTTISLEDPENPPHIGSLSLNYSSKSGTYPIKGSDTTVDVMIERNGELPQPVVDIPPPSGISGPNKTEILQILSPK